MISNLLKKFEYYIIIALIIMMMVVVGLSTIELAYLIIMDIIRPPILLFEIQELLEIFGFFMLILIGVELLETIKAYLAEKVVHSEIVLEVALIAIARKVIIIDLKEYSGTTIIGIALMIISISVAYFFLKRSLRIKRE